MFRGKKYNAAELHFLKEKQKLLKQLHEAEERAIHCAKLEAEVNALSLQVKVLENEKEELLKKLDMTPEEREQEKKSLQCFAMLSAMNSMGGFYK